MLRGLQSPLSNNQITQHDFRRTVATYLVIVGISGDMIMKIMGWKDCSMITNYTHFSTKHIKEFQEKGASTYLP